MEYCAFDNNVIIHKIVDSSRREHPLANEFFDILTKSVDLRGVLLLSVEKEFFDWCGKRAEILMRITQKVIRAQNTLEIDKCLKDAEGEFGDNLIEHFRKYYLKKLLETKDVGTVTSHFFPQLMYQYYKLKNTRDIRFEKIIVPKERLISLFEEFPILDGKDDEHKSWNDARHLASTIELKADNTSKVISLATWDDKHLYKIRVDVKTKYDVNIKHPEEVIPPKP